MSKEKKEENQHSKVEAQGSEVSAEIAKHWQSYELMNDEKKLKELQGREFFEPLEPFINKLQNGKVGRKNLVKLMGASLAMASYNCVRTPVEKIIPYVSAPEYMKPGIPNYYSSVCSGCTASCGVVVKTRDGRPLKFEGNTDHPVSKGGICAAGQASLLELYDPERAGEPQKVENGKAKVVKWEELDKDVIAKIAANKGQTVILTGYINSPSTKAIITEFLKSIGDGKHIEFDATSPFDSIAKASAASYGKAVVPNYRFDRAEAVLSIDADFLGTWISPVEFTKGFTAKRELRNGEKKVVKFIAAETNPTVTGTNADLKIAIKPGDQRRFAFAVAKALSAMGMNAAPAVSSIDLDVSAKEMGIGVELIKRTAKMLSENKGKSLVVAGGVQAETADAIDLQIAVNMLNSMLGNDGKTVDYSAPRIEGNAGGYDALASLENDLKRGNVGVLIINDVNLAYQLPSAGWKDILGKAKLVVAVNDRLDETAALSSWLAPVSHGIESWGDSEPIKGVMAIRQPTIEPLFNTRSLEDSLIKWAGGTLGGSTDFYSYVKSKWAGKGDWVKNLQTGVYMAGNLNGTAGGRGFNNSSVAPLAKKTNSDSLSLSLYENVALRNGQRANNSIRQELPDPVSKATWDNYVAISPMYAEEKGIKLNNVVKVKSGAKEITLPALIQPGLHKYAVAIAIGYGRTAAGSVGNGVGKNAYELAVNLNGKMQFSGIPVTIEKTGANYKLAVTQDHHSMVPESQLGAKWEERPLVQSALLADYIKNPKAGQKEPEIPKIEINGKMQDAKGLYTPHEYSGNRWAMAVDLTQCTGCASCVLACQVENNIPVVGRDEVRRGRELSWMRIDRYYIGDPSKPEEMQLVHQPLMCQHCENAPCETVCPVAATVHSSEGTNDMIYNRCVGTRYCLNNCPFKVRRFNWMEYWKGTALTEKPRNLALNPDVTVRSRGVMEKCTLCSSRVAELKIRAKNEGRELKDGEIKTACQQSCPADAIVFGNVNDPKSEVSKLVKDPRSYRILEFLNVGPSVRYMSRVRNSV